MTQAEIANVTKYRPLYSNPEAALKAAFIEREATDFVRHSNLW